MVDSCAIRAKYLASLGISPPRQDGANANQPRRRKFGLLAPTMTGRAAARAAERKDNSRCSLSLRSKAPTLVHEDEVSICPPPPAFRVQVHATVSTCSNSLTLLPPTSEGPITLPPSPRVQFQADVLVKEIPSHRDYDKVSRRNMWNSKRVLEQNIQRNAFEYQADGMDWRNACEEEHMIRTRKGKLVHPALFQLIQENMARQQGINSILHRQR